MARGFLLLCLLGGCSVDDAFLDRQLFTCGSATECGPGWGCLVASPYAENFCAPLCGDEACDGVCAGDADPVCLRACLIAEDGTPGSCQSDDYSCIRTSVERDEGVCYPVESCEKHDECGTEEICLGQALADVNPGSLKFDNMYCVPAPSPGGECPPGSEAARAGGPGSARYCVPECTVTDTRCAPGFACLTQFQRVAPYVEGVDGPICIIGAYGLSCQDDTNCLIGRCVDTTSAQGSVCSITCNEASRLAGGCEGLVNPYSLQGLLYTMECDASAPSSDNSGVCVVRYNINYPGCTSETGSAYECASGLSCVTVSGFGTEICTRSCSEDAHCNVGLDAPPAMWLYECVVEAGICVIRNE